MKTLSVLFTVGSLGILAGCSSRSSPTPGSPGFFWAVAQESYRTGDVVKANNTLCELSHSENSFSVKARPWHLVLAAGLSQGYSELADAYDAGATMNLTSPLRFRKEASSLRSLAASAALDFTQTVHETLILSKDASIGLAFRFPPGTAAEPEGLKKISYGIWLPDNEREALLNQMLQRGVVRAASSVVGNPDDPVKAQAVFQATEFQVPRAAFLFQTAKMLYEGSALFDPKRMDRPNRRALLCTEALKAIQSIPETEATKALAAEIQSTLRAISGTAPRS